MFGAEFFKNVLVCFTKFYNNQKMTKLRAAGKAPTREKLIASYQEKFLKSFQVNLKSSQFTFIDNGIDHPDAMAEPEELKEFQKTLEQISTFTKAARPFFCQDIKKVLAEKDQLRKKIEEVEG